MNIAKLLRLYKIHIVNKNTFSYLKISKNFSSVAENARSNGTVKSKPLHSNTPFLKNTFAGIFDKNVLIFPESLSKNEIKQLEEKLTRIKEFSKTNGEVINSEAMSKMNELGLLSLLSSDKNTDWTATGILRLFEDLHPDLCHFLYNHNLLGTRCIEAYASEDAKETVLPQLSSNHSSVAFCFHEDNMGDDLSQTSTQAEVSKDGLTYVINGRKTWVTMVPGVTDFLVVFAKVKGPANSPFAEPTQQLVTAFLVDKSASNDNNLLLQGPMKPLGNPSGLDAYNIDFVDVKVPSTHVLGHVGGGFKIAVELLYGSLYLRTSNHASVLKTAIGDASKYCLQHKQFNKSMSDLPMIQDKLGSMNVHVYVMESMAYATAGMVDGGMSGGGGGGGGARRGGDVFVESACTQLYSSQYLRSSLENGLSLLGRSGCYGDNAVAKQLTSLSYDSLVSNDMLRRYIALNCLQHAGVVMQDSLRKYRNPLNHFSHLVREGWRRTLLKQKQPPLIHRLHHSVHPDLSICAESLETRVMHLQQLVLKYWSIFFNKLEEEEMALRRFADVAVHIYAITCCLARATRSKSIGLMNADYEIMTCQAVIARLIERIDDDMEKLELGDHSNGDIYRMKVAKETFKKQSHPLQHPLSRTW